MSQNENIPRLLLGAAASGSGKTLITCGILQALKNRGLRVASFKCGPDYIDPMFHSKVIGTKSRNLDTFFTDRDTVRYLLWKNTRDCDVAVLEGVMGYYDGIAGTTIRASAFDVAQKTETPVVFVVNCKGMSLSLVPYIKGFLEYKDPSGICGVILNQISPMLYPRMKKIIEEQLPVKVFGYVPKVEDCLLESRHLGLVMPEEIEGLRQKLEKLADIMEESIDLDGLLALAKQAKPYETIQVPQVYHTKKPVRIALAKDQAFCFFYEDNLDLLRQMGASLVEFSPVHDEKLPEDVQGLLLFGGYPELYARALSQNEKMRHSIAQAIREGLPYMAECGGFLYLHEQLEDMEGNFWPMVGMVKGKAYRRSKLSRFGYISLEEGSCFGKQVGTIGSHEFHYYDSENCGDAFLAQKPESKRSWRCIHSSAGGMMGFPHMYYYNNRKVPEAFLQACEGR
jgi:cobyrinic acid a,c-diamide synthase